MQGLRVGLLLWISLLALQVLWPSVSACEVDGTGRCKENVRKGDGAVQPEVHRREDRKPLRVRVKHLGSSGSSLEQPRSPVLRWDDLVPRRQSSRRQKRQWNIPPISLSENSLGPFPEFLVSIQSDKSVMFDLRYSITGNGADLPPAGLFIIDSNTGELKVTRSIDREEYNMFRLKGHAVSTSGSEVELPCDLKIAIIDQNDNPPIFNISFQGAVKEGSAPGTVVMQLIATDRDDPRTANARLYYKILSQTPPGSLFVVNEKTGIVTTMAGGLDRETTSSYSLSVLATDSIGAGHGLSSLASYTIRLIDINDNAPIFSSKSFSGKVVENMVGASVATISCEDRDEEFSQNWRAVYSIVSGNSGGWFAVHTDPKTNQGIITTVKALDYESMQQAQLGVSVQNEVPLVTSTGQIISGYKYDFSSVAVTVLNQAEGPVFLPPRRQISISEGAVVSTLLTTFTAQDGDKNPNARIRYQKLTDVANWLRIDPVTGAVYTTAVLDRESQYVHNNTYTATFLAIKDGVPAMSSTGTIVLALQDVNDHAPALLSSNVTACTTTDPTQANVTATDLDDYPNAEPLRFEVVGSQAQELWVINPIDDRSAFITYRSGKAPNGVYEVPVRIQDRQGKAGDYTVLVGVCECFSYSDECRVSPFLPAPAAMVAGAGLSPGAIAALVLSLLLLPLLALLLMLLFSKCCPIGAAGAGGAGAGKIFLVPAEDCVKGSLMAYHDEGAGEVDKNMALSSLHGGHAYKNGGSVASDATMTRLNQTLDSSAVGGMAAGAAGAAAMGTGIAGGVNSSETRNEVTKTTTTTHSSSGAHNALGHAAGAALGGTAGAGQGMAAAGGDAHSGYATTQSHGYSTGRRYGAGAGGFDGGEVYGADYGMSDHGTWAHPGRLRRVEAPPIVTESSSSYHYRSLQSHREGVKNVELFLGEAKSLADRDPSAPPYETLLIYDYEGNATPTDSLSICSVVANEETRTSRLAP